jgi:hypothetical protein
MDVLDRDWATGRGEPDEQAPRRMTGSANAAHAEYRFIGSDKYERLFDRTET